MFIQEDPKNILRDITAETLGVSSDKVTFSNLRNKKKKRKKIKKNIESENNNDTIHNQEGFGIDSVGTEVCSYDKIGKSKTIRDKNSLEEWGAFDFFKYARDKYNHKYSKQWDLNIGGSSLEINRIRDKFYDLFGFCCNLIMRDYIDFFFEYYMDNIIRKKGTFYFNHMRKEEIMCEFYDGYDFSRSFFEYTRNIKKKNKIYITNKEIQEAYLIGDTSLVSNYGIVISLNWLIIVKKMSSREATKLVVEACKELTSKGLIDVIQNATELYSPYPSNLLFKSPQLVINKINKNIKLNVEFKNNDKMKFLQKGDI